MRPSQSARLVTEASHAAILAAADEHEPALARVAERILRRYVRDSIRAWEESTRVSLVAAAAEEWVPPEYNAHITSAFLDDAETNAQLEAATAKYRAAITTATGDALGKTIGVRFDQRNRLLDGVIASQRGMKITTAPESVVRPMMQSLQESYDSGKSIPRAARAMRAAGYEHSQKMAERIARTETISSSNAASLAMVKMGTDLGFKVWMANIDLRTRKTHISANDQTVPIESQFVVGGALMDYPGDPSGPGEEVINCRCSLGYSDTPNLNLVDHGAPTPVATSEASGAPSTWGAPNPDQTYDRATSPLLKSVLNERDAALAASDDPAAFLAREAALGEYRGRGHFINRWIRSPSTRGGFPIPDDYGPEVERLKEMFNLPGEHGVLPVDTLLIRGTSVLGTDMTAGSVITDKAFTSTCLDTHLVDLFAYAQPGRKGIVLRIHAPAGTKYLVGAIGHNELVLEPGTRIMLVGRSTAENTLKIRNTKTIETWDAIILKPGQTPGSLMAALP